MSKLTVSALVLAMAAGAVMADPQPGDKAPAAPKPTTPAKIVPMPFYKAAK